MSARVRLAAKLPGDEAINGFDAIAHDLCANPDRIVYAVCAFGVSKVTHDFDANTDLPTLVVRRAEPLGELAEVPQSLLQLLERKFEDRTGRKALPFDQLELDDEDDL